MKNLVFLARDYINFHPERILPVGDCRGTASPPAWLAMNNWLQDYTNRCL
jgi:hypothetical protein